MYPVNDPAGADITLTEVAGEYDGQFDTEEPTLEGYVQVWVDEAEPRREGITNFTIGGSPGYQRGGGGYQHGGGGYQRGGGTQAVSANGEAILFAEDLQFKKDEFLAIQTTSASSTPPPIWATLVGQVYRLVASNDDLLDDTSLSISYLERDVPPGEEAWLKMYHWNAEEEEWEPIEETGHDSDHNFVSARTQAKACTHSCPALSGN